jgi:transcriptional regulator with XRE-family HTH domain
VILGERLRAIREEKKLSQGDMERKTGLRRSYISRVENGHTIPAIETLEKIARALDVPMYAIFYEGEKPPEPPKFSSETRDQWGSAGKDARFLNRLQKFLSAMDERQRRILMAVAVKMARGDTGGRKEKADSSAAAAGSGPG